MDKIFEVVTDIHQIARLNRILSKQLLTLLPHRENRVLTYPSGSVDATVHFEAQQGTKVRSWASRVTQESLENYFLYAEPGSTKRIEISVQLNFPAGSYSRYKAGAFVQDNNGDFYVAHRGKLTKGRAGLKRDKVFAEFASSTVDADDNGTNTKFILISALNGSDLVDNLFRFAEQAREVATRLALATTGAEEEGPAEAQTDSRPATPGQGTEISAPAMKLSAYFKEFSGMTYSEGFTYGPAEFEHGEIVEALVAAARSRGECVKSKAIDLGVLAPTHLDLFEVKTSAKTTDVYTGVGQLFIHGESLKAQLGLEVRRYLVLPEGLNKKLRSVLVGKTNIKLVTYLGKGACDGFVGLED